jgi:hypothetical protein
MRNGRTVKNGQRGMQLPEWEAGGGWALASTSDISMGPPTSSPKEDEKDIQ